MPIVSVLMPVRNAEPYVSKAVRSVLDQRGVDLELIVIDDGSTDNSRAEVERVADDRVTIIEGPQAGAAAEARHAGLARAAGSIIALQDADDLSTPDRLSRSVDRLTSDSALGAVGCGYLAIDEHGTTLHRARHLVDPLGIELAAYSFNPVAGASLVFRREALEAVGGFRSMYPVAEDYDLVCRLLRHGYRVANLPDELYLYRWHEQSTSAGKRDELDEAMRQVADEHWKLWPPAGPPSLRERFRSAAQGPRALHASVALQLAVKSVRSRRRGAAAAHVVQEAVANARGVTDKLRKRG